MCGRYTAAADPRDLDRMVRAGTDPDVMRLFGNRFNIAPRQWIGVVEGAAGTDPAARERRVRAARWGFLPSRARSSRDRMQPINARDDGLATSRMWRPFLEPGHRILVPADGWYEWVRSEDPKSRPAPMHHQVDGGSWFAFAGLLNITRVDDLEEPLATAAIVTTHSAGPAARIHDRMPAVLADSDQQAAWLDPGVRGTDALPLIAPFDDGRVTIRPASHLVNSTRNDGPELLAPDEGTEIGTP